MTKNSETHATKFVYNEVDEKYAKMLKKILNKGRRESNRTGVDTLKLFGASINLDLTDYKIPLLSTKKMNFDAILAEAIFFMRGLTNVSFLTERNCKIWNLWAADNGEIGPMYGEQLRAHKYVHNDKIEQIDQVATVIGLIRNNPDSRRIMWTSLEPGLVPDGSKAPKDHVLDGMMSLAPCHNLITQFDVDRIKGTLTCSSYQRSADFPIGVPLNLASMALITHMIAECCGLKAERLFYIFGDYHIYIDQIEAVQRQLQNDSLSQPTIKFNRKFDDPAELDMQDVELIGYEHHAFIKIPVAV